MKKRRIKASLELRASSFFVMSVLLERQVLVHRCHANDATAADAASAAGGAAPYHSLVGALRRRWEHLRQHSPRNLPPILAAERSSDDGSSNSTWIGFAPNDEPSNDGTDYGWEPGIDARGERGHDDETYSRSVDPAPSVVLSPEELGFGNHSSRGITPTRTSSANDVVADASSDGLRHGWLNVDVRGVRLRRYRRSSSYRQPLRSVAFDSLHRIPAIRSTFDPLLPTATADNSGSNGRHRRRDGASERPTLSQGGEAATCSVQIDPASFGRLLALSSNALYCVGLATLGSLRLLAPLLVARRVLNVLGELLMDWYRGYYLRTTYESMQLQYYHYYQGPAILRSLGRLVSQIGLFFVLGRVMEWMVGLSHAPCVIVHDHRGVMGGGCHWWCGVLWLIAVVGTGHAGAAAIAVWGGPLRIQIIQSSSSFAPWKGGSYDPAAGSATGPRRPSARHIFTRPFRMLKWLRDPDQWIRAIAYNSIQQQRRRMRLYYSNYASAEPLRPFRPDPLLFPATWEPLRLLLLFGLAREMTSSTATMHTLMRQILVQQSFADEWYRVLLCEKRIAIGIFVMGGFLVSSLNLFWTVLARTGVPGSDAGLSIALLLPYLFSVIVSGYMNVFFYNDIRRIKKQEAATRAQPADFWLQGKFVLKSVQW
jgi:hypothetical protein